MGSHVSTNRLPLIPLLFFALAMGFFEAIVVVYIRELYYPEGFSFPLRTLPAWLGGVELLREATSLVMIAAVAWLAGRSPMKRLSGFLFIFGVWDMVYYVALKLLIGWPASVFTWDILFLIPLLWSAPVLAPLICSLVMILMALLTDSCYFRKRDFTLHRREILLIFSGALIIFVSFIFDFTHHLLKEDFIPALFTPTANQKFMEITTGWVPENFRWELFTGGLVLIASAIFLSVRRALQQSH